MNSLQVSDWLKHSVKEFSVERRDYVGISNVGKCQRQAYMEIVHGVPATDFVWRMGYAGRLFEMDVKHLLNIAGLLDARECNDAPVICPKNPLVKGHIDGVSKDGDLIEIKSVSTRRWQILRTQNRPLHEHKDQVMLYMHFGGWRNCLLIYVCRETFEHKVFDVRYDVRQAEGLERKILALAEAVAKRVPPACECGKCPVAAERR